MCEKEREIVKERDRERERELIYVFRVNFQVLKKKININNKRVSL